MGLACAVQAHHFVVERHINRDRRRISLKNWQLICIHRFAGNGILQLSLWLKKKNQG